MKLGVGTYLLMLIALSLLSYGVMYIIRCIRRKEIAASVGMTLLCAASVGALALLWLRL